jgi:hypothetical protein
MGREVDQPCDEPGCGKKRKDGVDTWLAVHEPTGRQFIVQAMAGEEGLWEVIRMHRLMPPTIPFQVLLHSTMPGPSGFKFTRVEHSHSQFAGADRVRLKHERKLPAASTK